MQNGTRSEPIEMLAVVTGVAVWLLAGVAIGCMWGMLVVIVVWTSNISADTVEHSTVLAVFGFLAGMVPCYVGGSVAARTAGHSKLKHAVATGVLLLALSIVCWLGGSYWDLSEIDLGWGRVANLLLIVPVTALGGRMGSATD